ncbi:MAG: hypothetical protein ACFE95_14710 [Candidatus Hodarchaeota archaeon]
MNNIQIISGFDQKYEEWLKTKSDSLSQNFKEISIRKKKFQYHFHLIQYLIQIPLFLGAALLPWFRFIKNVSGLVIIDAGAMQLNDWTASILLFGAFCSFCISFWLFRNPNIKGSKYRWINLFFVVLCVPVLFSFIDPKFAPGLGGRHEGVMRIYWISILGYSIWPNIGYTFIIITGIVISIGFLFSLLWQP